MAERATRKTRPSAAPATDAPAAAVASSLRGRIRAVPAADAEAIRAFFAQERHWLLADGGLLRTWAGTASGAGVPVGADDTLLWLRFDTDAPAGEGLAWSDHVGRARTLAWGIAHEAQLRRLGEALGTALLPAVDDDATPGNDGIWLDFDIDEDPQADPPPARTRGAMRVPVAWLSRLSQRAEPRYAEDPAPPLGHWRDVAAPVSVGFQIAPLSMRDWRSLRPGDVIVVGRGNRPPQFRAVAARKTWPLAAADDGWRVDGAPQDTPQDPPHPLQEHLRMSENDTSSDAPAQVADDPARNLPVRVAFEIGQLELSVGELADLQAGYLFALPTHLEGANVTILANGRAAGRGEVVAVGDTLGVRLLSWS